MADDVQVQFYMMSPYMLKTLSTNGTVLFGQVHVFFFAFVTVLLQSQVCMFNFTGVV